jgi:hypothetical protein
LRNRFARAVSIAGHPALLTPAVGLAALAANGAPPQTLWAGAAILVAIAAAVLGFGWLQVRRGAWAHIDASRPAERRTHNLLGLGAFLAGAAAAAAGGMTLLAAALAAGGLVMAAAMILSRWLKPSQHVAFAALSAVVAWTIGVAAAAAVLAMLGLLAWSRLELRRHTVAEVVAGGLAGLAAGALLVATAPLSG